MHDRRSGGDIDHQLLINYYITNIEYEKIEFNIPKSDEDGDFVFSLLDRLC